VESPSADGGLEVGAPTNALFSLDLGEPLAALAAPVAKHAGSAPGAHPAQEAVDAAAVTFLGLIGALDRASVPEP